MDRFVTDLRHTGRFSWKRMARRVLSSRPLYRALQSYALRNNPITVLAYHTLGDDRETFDAWTVLRMEDFRRQVEWLASVYHIVDLDEASLAIGKPSKRRLAVLTFDDGEAGLHRHLLPFIDKTKIPVTIYVATQQIETGTPYWFDRIMNALQHTGRFSIDLTRHGLPKWTVGPETGPPRWLVISNILETLKQTSPALREELTSQIVAQAPVPDKRFTPLAPLTVAQLAELSQCPGITIGSHSHCHSLLDQISASEVEASAERSRTLLSDWTGQPIRHFAYPNGNHNREIEETICRLGFHSATALGMDLWDGSGRFAVPRVAIGRYDDLDRFKLRLARI
jgi:peptidoglycan/xylan/chitin deacetylase (PgdA/CDA1 family)